MFLSWSKALLLHFQIRSLEVKCCIHTYNFVFSNIKQIGFEIHILFESESLEVVVYYK